MTGKLTVTRNKALPMVEGGVVETGKGGCACFEGARREGKLDFQIELTHILNL